MQYMLFNRATKRYDKEMYLPGVEEYYEGSDFYNFGYWPAGTASPRQACENLVERLLDFVPEKKGTILDVACGKGATTRQLLKYYDPSDVTGINVSAKQLERARVNAPGCRFLLMDATKLEFEDNTFDTVICVEAAFHFNTREKFLREACRVLKPGGYLVLSDALVIWLATWANRETPTRSYVRSPDAYKKLCRRAGFDQVEVVDAKKDCWGEFFSYTLRWSWHRFLRGQASAREMLLGPMIAGGVPILILGNEVIKHYVLLAARKPAAE